MDEWERILKREIETLAAERDTRELSQIEIYRAVSPALEEAFPEMSAYNSKIQDALQSLADRGDVETLGNGQYRITIEQGSGGSTATTAADGSGSADTTEDSTELTPEDVPEPTPSDSVSDLATKSLYELLKSCQMGEAAAIVGGHIDRNDLRQELYVETDEDRLLSEFFVDDYKRDGKHLVITGSAGDGKSALLSRAFKQAQQDDVPLEAEHIHMDATAARGKHQTYDDTLDEFLDAVHTCLDAEDGPRTGLAINLGLAIDFFERQGYADSYPNIWEALDGCRNKPRHTTDGVTVINLSHRATYNTAPAKLGDGLLSDLVEKFAFDDEESPFHEAYARSAERCPAVEECPLHYNAAQFTDPAVRQRVSELIAASGLIHNGYLNPRAILDTISKMIVPNSLQVISGDSDSCPIGETATYGRKFDPDAVFWNAVFRQLAGPVEDERGYLDPAAQASKEVDEAILSWSAGDERLDKILADTPVVDDYSITVRTRTALRKQYLTGESSIDTARNWSWFEEFAGALTFFDPPGDSDPESYKRQASNVVDTVTQALKGWSGSGHAKADWIEFVDGVQSEYKFLSKWEKPTPNIDASKTETREETIPGQLWAVLEPGTTNLEIPVPVTFELYLLMKRISRGYRPNARDLERSEGIRLIHSRLSEFTDKKETVRVTDKADDDLLHLDRDAFGTVQIERGRDST